MNLLQLFISTLSTMTTPRNFTASIVVPLLLVLDKWSNTALLRAAKGGHVELECC